MKTDLAALTTTGLFDLIEDASAVGFSELEDACLMRVAWIIKGMDEETVASTFALDRPWDAEALQEAVGPGSSGESLGRFLSEPE